MPISVKFTHFQYKQITLVWEFALSLSVWFMHLTDLVRGGGGGGFLCGMC